MFGRKEQDRARPSRGGARLKRSIGHVLLVVLSVVTVGVWVLALARFPEDPTPASNAAPQTSVLTAYIGDSYTQGTGASAPALRWTTLTSRAAGWEERNLGRGGTGYVTTAGPEGCGRPYCPTYQEMVPGLAAPDPDIVVVAGGQNDLVAYGDDPDGVRAAVLETYRLIRETVPDARIIAVGPSVTGSPSPVATGLAQAVQAAAAEVGAEYVDLLQPPVLGPGLLAPDGVHPNDEGHAAISQRFLQALGPVN